MEVAFVAPSTNHQEPRRRPPGHGELRRAPSKLLHVSLCWLRLGDGEKALDDAVECKQLRPKRAKAYYRKGAALMLLKEYGSAYDTLYRGLELDPESEEMEKLFWEAMELK
ncbi:hsp70-Hsp90 organizing protein 2-like isoform X2 [Phragmites australis]|uniref:hsp70-Hsp90 organizing protein 2-like isoform X2 n=1 Tax=Phragmites australis TaxID=29695 RepID=UPI002D79EC24|nr:hsp70-Hsp90 organizing protein 2-like isoform X2 [Phragmites australis]